MRRGGQGAPDHPEEARRLAALDRLEILDTDREPSFDDIVELASQVTGSPVSAISLVASDRQWFKASVGLDVRETPRSQAFCAYAILDDVRPLVVPNATLDDRFVDNALVTGGPGIRAYAGVPIRDGDSPPLGTLCVIDTEPHDFDAAQLEALSRLARLVEEQLAVREALRSAESANAQLARINESMRDLSSFASHDLRSPIRGIRTLVEFLEEDCGAALGDIGNGHLEGVIARTDMMERLVTDLLSYLEAGVATDTADGGRPREVIDAAVAGLSVPTGAEVSITVDDNAADALVPLATVTACLRNLIDNGLRHGCPDGGTVRVLAERRSGDLLLSIADDGPGITDELRERMFEPFQSGRSGPAPGSGLGLAVVQRAAFAHGGDVWVDSNAGAGATFWLRWPITGWDQPTSIPV